MRDWNATGDETARGRRGPHCGGHVEYQLGHDCYGCCRRVDGCSHCRPGPSETLLLVPDLLLRMSATSRWMSGTSRFISTVDPRSNCICTMSNDVHTRKSATKQQNVRQNEREAKVRHNTMAEDVHYCKSGSRKCFWLLFRYATCVLKCSLLL